MLKDLLNGSGLLDLPAIATVFFFCMFVGVVVWVMRRSRTEVYRKMANLPLEDGDEIGGSR